MKKTFAVLALAVLGIALVAASAGAFPDAARSTKMSCATCHSNVAGGADLTDAGKAFKSDKKVPAASVEGTEYSGTASCRKCHSKYVKAWGETDHAKALSVLTSADPKRVGEIAALLKVTLKGPADKEDACLNCHVVGFHLTGGFPAADTSKVESVSNVGCENCHGPGAKHIAIPKEEKDAEKAAINGKVTEVMCKNCHTPEMSPKFNFEEYKKKGVHVIPTE